MRSFIVLALTGTSIAAPWGNWGYKNVERDSYPTGGGQSKPHHPHPPPRPTKPYPTGGWSSHPIGTGAPTLVVPTGTGIPTPVLPSLSTPVLPSISTPGLPTPSSAEPTLSIPSGTGLPTLPTGVFPTGGYDIPPSPMSTPPSDRRGLKIDYKLAPRNGVVGDDGAHSGHKPHRPHGTGAPHPPHGTGKPHPSHPHGTGFPLPTFSFPSFPFPTAKPTPSGY